MSFITLSLANMSFADALFQEDAAAICQAQTQKTYKTACMKEIKTAHFNHKALEYCADMRSWGKIKTCLPAIKNIHYDNNAFQLCTSANGFTYGVKDCLKEIADKTYVSDIEVAMCAEENTHSRKVKCLKQATSKPYEKKITTMDAKDGVTPEQALADLQNDVKTVYDLIRANKQTDATLLLHDLVNGFEEKQK